VGATALDAIPALRNKAKGHSWTMADERYEELVRLHLPALAGWLSMLGPFRQWVLVSPQAVSTVKGLPVWDCWILTGNRVKAEVRQLRTERNLAIGGVYMVREQALHAEVAEAESILSLSPLLQVRRTGGMVQELFLYQGGDGRKAIYLGSFSSDRHESAEEAHAAFDFLSSGTLDGSGYSLRAERILAPIRSGCIQATESFIQAATDRRVYLPSTFAPRPRVREQIDAFLLSGLPCTLLHAPSGMGKTSLMADLGSEWLKAPAGRPMVGLFHADSLPEHGHDLPAFLATSLQSGRDLAALLSRVAEATPGATTCQCLLVIDGIDRHPDPQGLVEGITAVARLFRGSPRFRILGTCTAAVTDLHLHRGGSFDEALFFSSTFGLSSAREGGATGINLPAMAPEELETAFKAYREDPAYGTLTAYESLTEEMASTLSNPLILRLAMAVYHGRALPQKVFGLGMITDYVGQRVFKVPARLDVVAEVVDLMVATQMRSLPFEALRNHPRLRRVVLEGTAAGPLRQLCDDQVVTLRTVYPASNLPFPPTWNLEFTFDRVLDYLVFWRMVDQQPGLLDDPGPLVRLAQDFGPARGALLLLDIHLTGQGRLAPLVEQFALNLGAWGHAFWMDLLSELLEFTDEGTAVTEALLAALVTVDAPRLHAVVKGAAEDFFRHGDWDQAYRLLTAAAAQAGAEPAARALKLNQCVQLEKNMDRWVQALETSDLCLALLKETQASPDLQARILINRSSVIFDLGPRAEVPRILAEAASLGASSPFLSAAVANNLGLYRLYHDEPGAAEELFRKGLELSREEPVQTAYLETNLSLALLARSLVEPGILGEAEAIATRALAAFRQSGHLQGSSYAVSLKGIFAMLREDWIEAETCFLETHRTAQRLGEQWTDYGAEANLACLDLRRTDRESGQAWPLALKAMKRARQNQDAKGVGDAGLLAGCAGLKLLQARGEDPALAKETSDVLLEARAAFTTLGQRLGQAMAQWGLQTLQGEPCQPASLLGGTLFRDLAPGLQPLPWHMMLLMEVF
jgi:hypothetical protein